MENAKNIRLGIIDDDRLLVQLLKPLIEKSGRIIVTLISYSGNEFLNRLDSNKHPLDAILLDLRMKNGTGLEVMAELKNRSSDIKVIILSSFYRLSFIGQMLKFGAHAFLSKQIDRIELINTIIEVVEKGHYLTEEQLIAIRSQLSSRTPKLHLPQKNGLTTREIEILKLLCQQMNTSEIAKQLYISPKTVESHKSNLIVKAGVKNMAGLVIYAAQNRIVNPDELILLDH